MSAALRSPGQGQLLLNDPVNLPKAAEPALETAADTLPSLVSKPPKGSSPKRCSVAQRVVDLASSTVLSDAERGELDTLLGRELNTNSPKLCDFLYGAPPQGWGFPRRYIKEGGRNTARLARSIDALLANYRTHPDRRL